MNSSREGRLGLKKHRLIEWKGRTFSQVSSVLQKNDRPDMDAKHLFFAPLPLKLYRKELVTAPFSRKQTIRSSMEIPGGTLINSETSICNGEENTLDINYDESKTARCNEGCKLNVSSEQRNAKYLQSLSQQDNARRRVRSGGMSRPRYNNTKNGRLDSYQSSSEYMHSRNKTYKQNQFSNLRIGDTSSIPGSVASMDNVYSSNTIQYCSNDTKTDYVPVYYKPNNSKFAQQGAVDSGARLLRLKYDTITSGGNSMREAYGAHTANALAYGVPANGYTIKDKIGYPNICTPKIVQGKMCTS